MPIFKVSEDLKKYSSEVLRLELSIITDCPQCRSASYKNGTCEDCSYVDPRWQASYQKWQEAQMAQQQVGRQKAASKFSFSELKTTKVPCPRCKQSTFEIPENGKKVKRKDYYKRGGDCTNRECNFSKPPQGLGFNSKDFVGVDNEWLKGVGGIQQNFKPIITLTASKIEENKKILKRSYQQQQVDPGAFLDNSMTVSLDKTTRMDNMLQTNAQLELQSKQQKENDGNAENSEEQQ